MIPRRHARPLQRRPLAVIPAAALLVVAALSVGCSGDGGAGQPQSTTASSEAQGDVAHLPPLIEVPAPTGAEAVLGSSNREAAAEVAARLDALGFGGAGMEVFVFPMVGLDASMLVVDMDMAAATALTGGDAAQPEEKELWKAISEAPAVEAHNISRLALYLHGADEEGTYGMTITLPMSAVSGLADGTLTQDDIKDQVLIRTEQGAP